MSQVLTELMRSQLCVLMYEQHNRMLVWWTRTISMWLLSHPAANLEERDVVRRLLLRPSVVEDPILREPRRVGLRVDGDARHRDQRLAQRADLLLAQICRLLLWVYPRLRAML